MRSSSSSSSLSAYDDEDPYGALPSIETLAQWKNEENYGPLPSLESLSPPPQGQLSQFSPSSVQNQYSNQVTNQYSNQKTANQYSNRVDNQSGGTSAQTNQYSNQIPNQYSNQNVVQSSNMSQYASFPKQRPDNNNNTRGGYGSFMPAVPRDPATEPKQSLSNSGSFPSSPIPTPPRTPSPPSAATPVASPMSEYQVFPSMSPRNASPAVSQGSNVCFTVYIFCSLMNQLFVLLLFFSLTNHLHFVHNFFL